MKGTDAKCRCKTKRGGVGDKSTFAISVRKKLLSGHFIFFHVYVFFVFIIIIIFFICVTPSVGEARMY